MENYFESLVQHVTCRLRWSRIFYPFSVHSMSHKIHYRRNHNFSHLAFENYIRDCEKDGCARQNFIPLCASSESETLLTMYFRIEYVLRNGLLNFVSSSTLPPPPTKHFVWANAFSIVVLLGQTWLIYDLVQNISILYGGLCIINKSFSIGTRTSSFRWYLCEFLMLMVQADFFVLGKCGIREVQPPHPRGVVNFNPRVLVP